MQQIAIYGKGGAGKSTVVCNLSAVLAEGGNRVLQIGCDPKHDSTRNILHGAHPATGVDLFMKQSPDSISADDLIRTGYRGIECIEVGGPEPGAGCAGLGIIKTLELIQKLDIYGRGYDYVFFDVLGDVVCGGFATPMRLKFAREVYIVVSGEMMSLYAANNICRGILRYARSGDVRLAGFIGNQRSPGSPHAILDRFAEKLGAPLIYRLPWDEAVLVSERRKMTVTEHEPDSAIAQSFQQLTEQIVKNQSRVTPKPMSDQEFETFFVQACKS